MNDLSKNFSLYFNKETLELCIKPYKNGFYSLKCTDEIKKFNENYYICTDRKKLRDKAKEIKEQWLKEAEDRIRKINELKIKNIY